MANQEKIGVDAETHALVKRVARHQHRTMASQVKHWATKEARKHKLAAPRASTFPTDTNLNKTKVDINSGKIS